MKYIDADLLRKEIDKWVEAMADAVGDYSDSVRFALQHFTFVLDSLQQEQRDFPTTDEEVEKFLATHPKVEVPDKYKTPDWLFKKQEQQEVDLEKEITNFIQAHYHIRYDNTLENGNNPLTVFDFEDVARHFYELGKNGK